MLFRWAPSSWFDAVDVWFPSLTASKAAFNSNEASIFKSLNSMERRLTSDLESFNDVLHCGLTLLRDDGERGDY